MMWWCWLEETLFPSQFLFSMRNLNSNGGINLYAPLVELSTPPNVAAHCTTGAPTKTASSIYPTQTQLTASFKLICLSLLKPYPCSPFISNLLPQHLHYLQWHALQSLWRTMYGVKLFSTPVPSNALIWHEEKLLSYTICASYQCWHICFQQHGCQQPFLNVFIASPPLQSLLACLLPFCLHACLHAYCQCE